MHFGQNVNVDPTAKKPWYANLAEQALAVFQAERLRAENKRRIDAGLPPLTPEQTRALAPTANVNVALPQDVKNAMYIGGAALIGLLMFMAFNKKRR